MSEQTFYFRRAAGRTSSKSDDAMDSAVRPPIHASSQNRVVVPVPTVMIIYA
jgi:hypothetical protein